ncbi:hypothetical protein DPMN_001258 [Dreissena polymorpha]|uniref:Myosin motor domain-containing protein n=1 Tax=Dreissena polymorpha TaxID=45954 RepID=A0A9D4RSN5_DREPO|nr:hypothetical protein DPMN_001258 [Dreissena polymorpha]
MAFTKLKQNLVFHVLFAVLCCLNERFAHDLFYTSAGSTVIAINPFKEIQNLYSRDLVMAYHENTEVSYCTQNISVLKCAV